MAKQEPEMTFALVSLSFSGVKERATFAPSAGLEKVSFFLFSRVPSMDCFTGRFAC